MWQRVQTLYLAIATALLASMFFSAKAVIPVAADAPDRIIKFTAYTPYLILLVVSVVLDFLALTTWKHRIFQMRTASLSAIILLGLQIWLVVDFIKTHNDPMFHVTAIFPVVATILDFLAARSILADELLVRSASRLRAAKRKK